MKKIVPRYIKGDIAHKRAAKAKREFPNQPKHRSLRSQHKGHEEGSERGNEILNQRIPWHARSECTYTSLRLKKKTILK